MVSIILSKRLVFALLLTLIGLFANGQDTLTYNEFLELVKTFHPTAQRADLQNDLGDALVSKARGNFDPVVQSKLKEKFFQDKYYYTLFNADVSLPTITGIELKGGFDDNIAGDLNPNKIDDFLSDQNYTPNGGTGYLGVKIPLGKGMFTDENRAGLRIAKQQREQQQALANLTLNDLLLEASIAYWDWYMYHFMAENLEQAVQVSVDRFEFVKTEYLVGESAANDTLKAFVQWQDRVQDYFEARRGEIKSFLNLNVFVWDDTLGLKQELTPESFSQNEVWLDRGDSLEISELHPSLRYYEAKRLEAIASNRLKLEKIKPKLDFEFLLLSNSIGPELDGFGNNQLWGLSFEFPLLVRTERADLRMGKIKLQETELMYNLKRKELINKLDNQYQQVSLLRNQLQTLQGSLFAYNKLVDAERLKFRLGESTLFELNTWEQNMINNQNKYLKLISKYQTNQAKINWVGATWE